MLSDDCRLGLWESIVKNSHWAFLGPSCDFEKWGAQPSELKFKSQEGAVLGEGEKLEGELKLDPGWPDEGGAEKWGHGNSTPPSDIVQQFLRLDLALVPSRRPHISNSRSCPFIFF